MSFPDEYLKLPLDSINCSRLKKVAEKEKLKMVRKKMRYFKKGMKISKKKKEDSRKRNIK
jgi:hypothetical protein